MMSPTARISMTPASVPNTIRMSRATVTGSLTFRFPVLPRYCAPHPYKKLKVPWLARIKPMDRAMAPGHQNYP